ncbi:unnamed protein product [Orchesella dallaii]|uniref:Uncharacterized protein n=1 Tax=Orchesella dallaii TaxID=48710 RepID=A0ABP1PQU4_9HEXA
MAFPPPLWCGSDPRTCPKIFAVLEMNFGKVDDKDKIKFQIADNYSTLETYDDDKHRTHCVLDLYTPENPARDIVKSKISSKFLLLTFGLQWIPIILLLSAVFHAISPTLCLMEYGGISPNGQSSPIYLQTTIGYICGVYIVFFKGYLLWLLVSYSANLSEIKMIIKKKERAKKQVAIVEEKANENENATEESEDIEANSKKEGKLEGVDKSASVNNNKPPPKIRHPSATSDSSHISDDDEDGDDEVEDESGLYDLLAFASSKQRRNRRSRVSMSTASPKPIQTNTKGTLGLGRFGKSFW